MDSETDTGLPIKFETDDKKIILNKDVKIVDFLNKKVQITYNLN